MAVSQESSSNITFRPAVDADAEFLFELYSVSRLGEISRLGWSGSEQLTFLRMQFETRTRAYAMQFPDASTAIVLVDGRPAGQIVVNRTKLGISLTDIAIHPGFQRRGVATRLIRYLQDEAAAAGVPLMLHVDKQNAAALTLYRGLGFAVTGGSSFDHEMRWAAAAPLAA